MTIRTDVQGYSPTAIIDLFILDATALGDVTLHRFHAGTAETGNAVVWNGDVYAAWPIEVSGISASSQGSPPTPKLRVSNIDQSISVLCRAYEDFVGARLTRKR